jgi:hypothetical protein
MPVRSSVTAGAKIPIVVITEMAFEEITPA